MERNCLQLSKTPTHFFLSAGREILFQIKNSLGPTDLQSSEANTVEIESRTLSRITRRTITENSSRSR
jgi:hypothetical protein